MFGNIELENKIILEEFAYKCGEVLLKQTSIKEFKYPESITLIDEWDEVYINNIKNISSNKLILKHVSGKYGIYALFEKQSNRRWTVRYIGHTHGNYARQRLFNHLIKKHVKTGAKLSFVQESVIQGKKIGISFLEIRPSYLRYMVEEILINKFKKDLIWNVVGKKVEKC